MSTLHTTNLKNPSSASNNIVLDTNGRVGIGTSSPSTKLEISGNEATANFIVATNTDAFAWSGFRLRNTGTSGRSYDIGLGGDSSGASTAGNFYVYDNTAGAQRITLDSSGRVGIGTTSVSRLLHISAASGDTAARIQTATSGAFLEFQDSATTAGRQPLIGAIGNNLVFYTSAGSYSERARIDSSGRLLVGTSSYASNGIAVFQGNASVSTGAGAVDIRLGTTRPTAADTAIGFLRFMSTSDAGGNYQYASIAAASDGASSSDTDIPGRLVFSTTADGAFSPTERMRISSDGRTNFGSNLGTSDVITSNVAGIILNSTNDNRLDVSRAGGAGVLVNRKTDDGALVLFYQDATNEGSISVSGTTVSYNGAHLSRWSQLPSGTERTEILRGSVLSNIDEMCEWSDEENEQLNRMKVSDVEGDKNVSGVFQAWDDDDDTYTNDFYCAMTGDFIIRIGAGTTVERGDLLMSAGDGTAKPQDDDIIRSKTIAKVTSTNVSCTYEDGSYCVPCVLMAC